MYEFIEYFRIAALKCGMDYFTDGSLHQGMIDAAFRIYRNASAGNRLADLVRIA